jgi:DNA-binding response OmpR family regulator
MEVRRHLARAEQEDDGMHTHGDQPLAPPLTTSESVPPADELRRSEASSEAREQQSGTIWHNLDGLVVQRNDAHRMLIIAGRWIQLSPTQYALLVPLLEHFGHPVSHAEIYQRAFGSSYSARDARRTYYHIDKLRPRLSPFGLIIRSVIDHGYMLLREPQEES